jgi:hypothetical protein
VVISLAIQPFSPTVNSKNGATSDNKQSDNGEEDDDGNSVCSNDELENIDINKNPSEIHHERENYTYCKRTYDAGVEEDKSSTMVEEKDEQLELSTHIAVFQLRGTNEKYVKL